jgi:hypothetical protein
MSMIYVHTVSLIHSFSGSILTAVDPKATCKLRIAAVLFSAPQNITLKRLAYASNLYNNTHSHYSVSCGSVLVPTSQLTARASW